MESIGKYWILFFMSKRRITSGLLSPKNIPSPKKVTRRIARMPNGSVHVWSDKTFLYSTCWHPRIKGFSKNCFKLTYMIIGEKKCAHNCFTVFNSILDDVLSDIYSLNLLAPLRADFTTPWGNFWCSTRLLMADIKLIEEIQSSVDVIISTEQVVKLRQCLSHIDEFRKA